MFNKYLVMNWLNGGNWLKLCFAVGCAGVGLLYTRHRHNLREEKRRKEMDALCLQWQREGRIQAQEEKAKRDEASRKEALLSEDLLTILPEIESRQVADLVKALKATIKATFQAQGERKTKTEEGDDKCREEQKEAKKENTDMPEGKYALKWAIPEIFSLSHQVALRQEKAVRFVELYDAAPELWRGWWSEEQKETTAWKSIAGYISGILSESITENLKRLQELSEKNADETAPALAYWGLPAPPSDTPLRAVLFLDVIIREEVSLDVKKRKVLRFIQWQETQPALFSLDIKENCCIL